MTEKNKHLAPEYYLEHELLTSKGLEKISSHINEILGQGTEIGTSLLDLTPGGFSDKLGILPEIIFGIPTEKNNSEQSYKWTVQINGEPMNARMVGQILRTFIGYKQAFSAIPTEDQEERLNCIEFFTSQAKENIAVAISKHKGKDVKVGNTNARTLARNHGLAGPIGIDAASPSEIVSIIEAITTRAGSITTEEQSEVKRRIESEIATK